MVMGFRRSPFKFKSGIYDPALAYLARGSITDTAERTAAINLFAGLKADGVYTKLNHMWLVSPTSEAAARLCAITLQSLTNVVGACGAPSYNSATGFLVGQSNGGFNTAFNPRSTVGSLMSSSSGHYSYYNKDGTMGTLLGVTDGDGYDNISVSCSLQANCATGSGAVPEIATCGGPGFYIVSRTATDDLRFYIDGVENASSLTDYGTTPPNDILYLGGLNAAGTPIDFCDNTFTWATCGAGLTPTQEAALRSRANTYLTAVGHL